MAQNISAFIYGQDGNDWGNDGGIEMGFPTANVVFMPLIPPVTLSTVDTNAKIKVFDGVTPYAQATEFFTDSTVVSLVTAANT